MLHILTCPCTRFYWLTLNHLRITLDFIGYPANHFTHCNMSIVMFLFKLQLHRSDRSDEKFICFIDTVCYRFRGISPLTPGKDPSHIKLPTPYNHTSSTKSTSQEDNLGFLSHGTHSQGNLSKYQDLLLAHG